MAGAVKKYAYINAKLRARLSKMISRDTFLQMIQANDITESLQLLRGSTYEPVLKIFHETGDIKMGELELLRQEIELLRQLKRSVQNELDQFIDIMLEQYEIEVLKDAFRYWFDRTVRGRSVEDAVVYLYREPILHKIDMDRIVYAESAEEILEILEHTPYRETVKEGLKDITEKSSLFELEAKLEQSYYGRLLKSIEQLSETDKRIAKDIVGVQIDIENINRVVRFLRFYHVEQGRIADFFIPSGKQLKLDALNGAFTAGQPEDYLSKILQRHYSDLAVSPESGPEKLMFLNSLMQEILHRSIKRLLVGYPFTIGIILAYVLLKRDEMRRIVYILNGKYYNLDENRIKRVI